MTVRYVSATAFATVLTKDYRTIVRWCEDGSIEHTVRGERSARRYLIVVRDGKVRVNGTEIPVE